MAIKDKFCTKKWYPFQKCLHECLKGGHFNSDKDENSPQVPIDTECQKRKLREKQHFYDNFIDTLIPL